MLHDDIQTLVCARLFHDFFPLGLQQEDDASDMLLGAKNLNIGQVTRSLRQPALLGRAALVCKTWHAAVIKHRRTKLLDAVEHINSISKSLMLYIPHAHMPFQSMTRFKVLLGSRDMYDLCFVRRMNDLSTLSAQCVIQTHDDKPTWTSLERHYALHELCLVSFRTLQPAEQEQWRLWRQNTKESLDMWLTQQYLIFKLRLL
jgi:hypothetical protein